jgi:hypothetical protein
VHSASRSAPRQRHGKSDVPRSPTGQFAPRDWDALRRDYENHEGEDLGSLATANGITLRTLQGYVRDKEWTRRSAAATAVARHEGPRKTTRRKPTAAFNLAAVASGKARTTMILRLYNAILRKLDQLENSMETDENPSGADHERQSRAIGSLINSVEKVDELSRPSAGADAPKSRATAQAEAAEAERARRELKARIQRLRERPVE